ncbi:MAG: hypothetical protein ACK58T_20760, partial [Phycisphaerae bacterium]
MTKFRYDLNGNRLSLTDALNNTTTWAYDRLNRVIAETDPLGRVSTSAYDSVGNRISTVDRRGLRMEVLYDALNRPIQEIWKDGSITVNTIRSEYFQQGTLKSTSDNSHVLAYQYDTLDRVTSVSTVGTNGLHGSSLQFQYDLKGNRTRRTQSTGTHSAVTTWNYDALDRTIFVSQTGSGLTDKSVRIEYEADGQTDRIVRYADSVALRPVLTSAMEYDGAGRMKALIHNRLTSSGAEVPLTGYQFQYNAAGWLTSANSMLDQSASYSYDATGQLVSVTRPQQQS